MLLMLLLCHDVQILGPIVRALFVAMMDYLVMEQRTPNLLLGHEYVLQNVAVLVRSGMFRSENADVSLRLDIASAFPIRVLLSLIHESTTAPSLIPSLASARSSAALLWLTNST